MSSESTSITAKHIAVALVAACKETGVAPTEAFTSLRGARKARIIAAAGCCARLGWPKVASARVFQIDAVRIAPSSLALASIGAEQLLAVAEALSAHGLTAGDAGANKSRSPWKAEPVPDPEPPKPTKPSKPRKAAVLSVVKPVKAASAPTPTPAPAPVARQPGRASAPRRLKAVVEPLSPSLRGRSAIELKPLTGQRLAYVRRFMESGAWRIEEVADLWDTHPGAIADALAGPMGVAA